MAINHDPMGYNNQPNHVAMQNFDVYSDRQEKLKIGHVIDVLLDQAGNLRYFIVELNSLMAGKQVLIPLQNAQVDLQTQRVYVQGLTKAEVSSLPPYQTSVNPIAATEHRTEVVREVMPMRSLEDSAPLEASAPLEGYVVEHHPQVHRVVSPVEPATTLHQSVVPPTEPPATMPPRTVSPPPISHVASAPVANIREETITPPGTNIREGAMPASGTTEIRDETVIPLREERVIVDRKKRKAGEV
ncbi:MAG TPA: PRC-barrel domain-containing protein, partial [Microcoleaceae cyanobacterium]